MSGPIVRTGTNPKFWEGWDKAFANAPKTAPKKAAKTEAAKAPAKAAPAKKAAKKSTKKKA